MAEATAAPAAEIPAVAPESVETTPAIPEAPRHTPNPHTKHFAAISRKERQIQAKMLEQKTQAAKYEQLEQILRDAPKNPRKAIEALGLTYDSVTADYVQGKNADDPSSIAKQARDEAVAARREAAELRAELQRRDQHRAVSDYKSELRKEIEGKADDFGLVRALDQHDDVYELIDLHYTETGEILSKADAAMQIEKASYQRETEKLERLLTVPKIKKWLSDKLAAVAPPAAETPPEPLTPPPATAKSVTDAPPPSSAPTRSAREDALQRELNEEARWKSIKARLGAAEKPPLKK